MYHPTNHFKKEGEALIELNCFPGWGPRLMLWVQYAGCRGARKYLSTPVLQDSQVSSSPTTWVTG